MNNDFEKPKLKRRTFEHPECKRKSHAKHAFGNTLLGINKCDDVAATAGAAGRAER